MSRKGEPEGKKYRSERIISINGQWFFLTRESLNPVGPFATREKANLALKGYVEDMLANKSKFEADAHIKMLKDNYSGDRY